MKVAGRMTAEVMDHLAELVVPGAVTGDLDRTAERLILEKGGIPAFKGYMEYPASVYASYPGRNLCS